MATLTEILNSIYSCYKEESCLTKSRAGQLEFITTMEYIHRYLFKVAKILEPLAEMTATINVVVSINSTTVMQTYWTASLHI